MRQWRSVEELFQRSEGEINLDQREQEKGK
jgi:hypothetical protein